ncbi:hypothetical protein D1007_44464 [Hordeum vulgare]|nr:hypothetical protein D1007_44464 [Hordeum vulgare]
MHISSSLQPSRADPTANVGTERYFTNIVKVDTHIRKTDLSVVYNNDPVVAENSINTLEHLLGEDDKYKVVGLDPEYTDRRAGHDQKVVNIPDYGFSRMDITNYLKVLKTSGLSCQRLVNIQAQHAPKVLPTKDGVCNESYEIMDGGVSNARYPLAREVVLILDGDEVPRSRRLDDGWYRVVENLVILEPKAIAPILEGGVDITHV